MPVEIIFEDQDLIFLNKPAGLVVNRAETIKVATLQDLMEEKLRIKDLGLRKDWVDLVPSDFDDQYGTPEKIFAQRNGMVHRLDKDTSGVMVWAKNPGSLVNLLKQFRERQASKSYLTLLHGKLTPITGEIDLPIKRHPQRREKFSIRPDGRAAVTQYQVEQSYSALNLIEVTKVLGDEVAQQLADKTTSYQGFSLVEAWPKTGRTHQLRVHFTHLTHPLVGDSKYVGRKRARLDQLWCPRQFLHAKSLELTHPRTGKKIKFEAPLTVELQTSLSLLH